MPDEPIDTPPDVAGSSDTGAAPAVGDSSPPPETGSPNGAPGSVPADPSLATGDQPPENPIDAALKDLPPLEQLTQEAAQGIKYAKALEQLRPIAEQARELTARYDPWKPVVEQFNDPASLQSAIELNNEFFKTTTDPNGQIRPDMSGVVAYLDRTSPTRVDALLTDALLSKVEFNGVTDTRLEHLFKHMVGKGYQETLAALKQAEAQPAGVIDPTELTGIKPEYQNIYRTLPQSIREKLQSELTSADGDPAFVDDYLRRASAEEQNKATEANRLESEAKLAQEQQTAFQNESQEKGREAVRAGYGETVNSILENVFKDVSNDTVSLTGDPQKDVFLKGLVGAALVNLSDPEKRPLTEKMLGLTVDPELDKQLDAWETATGQAVVSERYGDMGAAANFRREANTARQWIIAKGNDIGAQALQNLSAILGISNETQAERIARANSGRQHIQGNPLSSSGGNNGQPKFTTPLGPERNAEIAARFGR